MEEIRKKPLLGRLVQEKRFERYIVLGSRIHPGQIEGIYDDRGTLLYAEQPAGQGV